MTPPDGNRLGLWIEMEVEAGLRPGERYRPYTYAEFPILSDGWLIDEQTMCHQRSHSSQK